MTLTALPVRCDIELALVDRGICTPVAFRGSHHPSETAERVWLTILAFAWQWRPELVTGSDISDAEGPDLVAHGLDGRLLSAVFVGKPEPRRVLKAVDRDGEVQVAVLFESAMRLKAFGDAIAEPRLERLRGAELGAVEPNLLRQLAMGDLRRGKMSLTLSGDHFYIERDGESFDGPLFRLT